MNVKTVKNETNVLAITNGQTMVMARETSSAVTMRMINEYPDIMTEQELTEYLRIPQVSEAADYKNVINHLIRMRDLPCIHISRKRLFPLEMVRRWVACQQIKGAA